MPVVVHQIVYTKLCVLSGFSPRGEKSCFTGNMLRLSDVPSFPGRPRAWVRGSMAGMARRRQGGGELAGGRARRFHARARVGQGHCEELEHSQPYSAHTTLPRPSALPIPAPAPCVQPRARPLFCTVRCLRRQPSLSAVFPASLGLHHDEGEERPCCNRFPHHTGTSLHALVHVHNNPECRSCVCAPPFRTVVMAVAKSWMTGPLATSSSCRF